MSDLTYHISALGHQGTHPTPLEAMQRLRVLLLGKGDLIEVQNPSVQLEPERSDISPGEAADLLERQKSIEEEVIVSKDITSEPLTPGSPNKGTLAVYFECRQALKNRKTGTGSNCSAKLVLSSQISVKGKQEQMKHYRLKGCVAHGEGCGEEGEGVEIEKEKKCEKDNTVT